MKWSAEFTRRSSFVLILAGLMLPSVAVGSEISPKPLVSAKSIAIVTGANSTTPERKAAEILGKRILKRCAVTVNSGAEGTALPDADVTFVIGTTLGNALSKKLVKALGAVLPTLPNTDQQHPEGFAVKAGILAGKNYVVIAGVDERGTFYGVGWMLRAMTYLPEALVVPMVDVSDKPSLPIRGGRTAGPGTRAVQYGKLRPRTTDESTESMEDCMLLGTNLWEMKPEIARDTYGMLTALGSTSNELPGGFPKEWGADGGRSTKLVCVSVPEAREALLEHYDKMFREAGDYDFLITNSGDTAGCRCPKCEPWGATYIRLVHDMAGLLHKYHPKTKILATNQDLSNEGNQAIFDYLNSEDSSWLYALHPGPGSDEMQTYIRGPVNPRWFEYEGFGPFGNFLKYTYHQLPRTTSIVLFSDITHWMQAQYGVVHPDVALAAVYDRRSWNARPRQFYKVGQEVFHYAIGDFHYSEGMHDDFNKWFWYRQMWNLNLSAEAITREYCRYWFGPDAEAEAAEAIFFMEETLEKPVIDNPGIVKAVDLLHSAGKKIPPNLFRIDYRWHVMLGKALMDRYIQMELQHGRDMKREAEHLLADLGSEPKANFEKALKVLDQPIETEAMKAVRDEAKRVGEESNATGGYREPAAFIVDQYDLTEIGWWKDTIQRALAGAEVTKLRNTAAMILHYDDPGEGGFYEAVGWPCESAHLTAGQTLWGFRAGPGPSKMSYYSTASARGPRDKGVTFVYNGLDPCTQYVVRITTGSRARSSMLAGQQPWQGQPGQGQQQPEQPSRSEPSTKPGPVITANGIVVSEGSEVSTEGIAFLEFDIPRPATKDGRTEIVVTGASERPGASLHEIWLMRKDRMPWSVRSLP